MSMLQNFLWNQDSDDLLFPVRYEEEITRLTRELEARGGAHAPQHGSQNAGPSQPPPPAIGHGPRDLFGTIMAGGGPNGPPLAPPQQQDPQQQQHHSQIPPPPPAAIPQGPSNQPPQQPQAQQAYQPPTGFVNGKSLYIR